MSVAGWCSRSPTRSACSTARASCRASAARARGRAAWRGWRGEAPRERRGALLGSAMGPRSSACSSGRWSARSRAASGRRSRSPRRCCSASRSACGRARCRSAPAGESLAAPAEALRSRAMLAGMWLTALPAAAFGVLDVLVPLRLDVLGAVGARARRDVLRRGRASRRSSPRSSGRYTDRGGARPVVARRARRDGRGPGASCSSRHRARRWRSS